MPGFDGTGPRGMGPMTGGGRGFCAIPLNSGWPAYAGTPFRRPYASPYQGAYGFGPFAPGMTREQELELLKSETQALREELKGVETRIKQLSAEKK
jgi:hypothetical protein